MLLERGVLVKVNSVMIPGVNDEDLKEVSRVVKAKGAFLHNVMPLIAEAEHGTSADKRRLMLILSRNEAIAWLSTATAASITSTLRGIPGEVRIGEAEGLEHESAVNLDQTDHAPAGSTAFARATPNWSLLCAILAWSAATRSRSQST